MRGAWVLSSGTETELPLTEPNPTWCALSSAESRPTCRNCVGEDCSDNILEDILREGVLTSGYFAIVPLVSTKPPGEDVCF